MALARRLAIVGGAAAAIYAASSFIPNFKTPGVKNLEERHTAAGGSPHGTPAQASKLGNSQLVEGRQTGASKTPDSAHFQENIADQRPNSRSEMQKKFNRTQYGGDGGKTG